VLINHISETMKVTSSSRSLAILFVLLSFFVSFSLGNKTCDAEGTCSSEGPVVDPYAKAKKVPGVCVASTSIYSQGGTAQAYKPNAPLSSTVCKPESVDSYKYKTASWYINRRGSKEGKAPLLDITLKLRSCAPSNDGDCICNRLEGPALATNIVEIWQTRPDGKYTSLRNSDDCRAQVQVDKLGEVFFSTVAPGSSGIMGGLGPFGFDWLPYGPPIIHILVHVAGHEPLLLDLPAHPRKKTLEQQKFSLGDWRGVGWMSKKPVESVMNISSWEPTVEENRISIEFEISLQRSSQATELELCESYFYGLPASFFLEPIAVCSPSTLDFFAL
jgi:hypothetical protein